MSPRLQGIHGIAATLGDTFVTVENHERSMKTAPGNYSTKIGRGHRNVDLSVQWIVSVFLAGVRNDPKSAAIKVPELGNLAASEFIHVETTRKKFDDPRVGVNRPFSKDYTEEKKVHPILLNRRPECLFDLLCSVVEDAGLWLVGELPEERLPPPSGLKIQITLEPKQMASVSFFVSEDGVTKESDRVVRQYGLAVKEAASVDEDGNTSLERAAIISRAHILRLGGIYALSLNEQKKQTGTAKAATETASKPKNEEADNPARLSASSETLSQTTARNDTGTQRKISLTSSDLSARVCVSSRGSAPEGQSHEHTSHHHSVL